MTYEDPILLIFYKHLGVLYVKLPRPENPANTCKEYGCNLQNKLC